MKIRSSDELNSFFDESIVWRKRELTTAKLLISQARGHERDLLRRGCICLIYAHWEGFVKVASTALLNLIHNRGHKYDQLCPGLIALSIRSKYKVAEGTSKILIHTDIAKFYIEELHQNADVPWKDVIETRDNLNSEVLEEILAIFGIDYSGYATKKAFVDDKLLYYRNNIAHGKKLDVDESEYNLLHDVILSLIDQFRNDLENSACTSSYLRSSN